MQEGVDSEMPQGTNGECLNMCVCVNARVWDSQLVSHSVVLLLPHNGCSLCRRPALACKFLLNYFLFLARKNATKAEDFVIIFVLTHRMSIQH